MLTNMLVKYLFSLISTAWSPSSGISLLRNAPGKSIVATARFSIAAIAATINTLVVLTVGDEPLSYIFLSCRCPPATSLDLSLSNLRYKSSCIEARTSVPRQKKIARASPRSRIEYFTQVTANERIATHSCREKFYGVKAEFWMIENLVSC